MKLLYALCCLVVMTGQSYGQDYVPFPTNNAYWRYHAVFQDIDNETVEFMLLLNGEDSTYNNKKYHKIMLRKKTYPGEPGVSIENIIADGPDQPYGMIREDNKRIYFIQFGFNGGPEKILFDYNLNAGDAMPDVSPATHVTSLSSYPIDGNTNYPKFNCEANYQFYANPVNVFFYLEGVGGSWGLLEVQDLYIDNSFYDSHYEFMCFNNDNSGVSFNPDATPCYYIFPYSTPTGVNNISSTTGVSVSPNPCFNELNVSSAAMCNVALYNSNGQMVMSKKEVKGKTTMNVSVLPSGTYFLIVRDSNGNIVKREQIARL